MKRRRIDSWDPEWLKWAASSAQRSSRPWVIAGVVGVWSYFLPQASFHHFPAVLGEWISQDGPYNEHLVRDHGAMYLALGAASAYGLMRPSQIGYRLLGIAWTVFGVLHFAYHVTHLGHMPATDTASQVAVLVVAVLLGIALLISGRTPVSEEMGNR
ncbi:hypothetical protein NCC78_01260 [Micromonospora phytophila]|uniref:hypothetical protein n=1 Tax=Micromonospora phytophila TaxID=709888 RepID=UPI00202DF158|nr:hypothetical protein [Micromonospora phytophila]MCM0673358.1 hypothetical protein [Micromonospora phytophila]